MRRGNWAQHPVVLGKEGCPTVVRAADLERIGMPRRTVYRRCVPGGPWRRLLPGIIMLRGGEPTERQRIDAALLHGGKDAVITGLRAARLHGLKHTPDPDGVHILVPASREVTSTGFVTVERTTRLPSAVVRGGVPLAPAHRAVLDGARRLRDFDAIRAMLFDAVQRRRCCAEDLVTELDAGSQRGSALPRRALVEVSAGAHSVPEGDVIELWRRAGLPEPVRNVKVFDASGAYVGTPDGWLDEVALAWEADSVECHFDVVGYANTLDRNNRYAAAGIVMVQTLPSQLRRDPNGVIRQLRAAYEAACQRPARRCTWPREGTRPQ